MKAVSVNWVTYRYMYWQKYIQIFALHNQVHNFLSSSFAFICTGFLFNNSQYLVMVYWSASPFLYFRLNTIFPSIQAALKKREQSLQVRFSLFSFDNWLLLNPASTTISILVHWLSFFAGVRKISSQGGEAEKQRKNGTKCG